MTLEYRIANLSLTAMINAVLVELDVEKSSDQTTWASVDHFSQSFEMPISADRLEAEIVDTALRIAERDLKLNKKTETLLTKLEGMVVYSK